MADGRLPDTVAAGTDADHGGGGRIRTGREPDASAARAAANELSTAAFRQGTVALDPEAAAARARAWLAPETGTVRVLASPTAGALDRVEVAITREGPTSFIRIVGVARWRVTATATHQLQFSP